MRLSLELLGFRLALDVTAERDQQAYGPPQGATCGDLERQPTWDHDAREPLGFTNTERKSRCP